MLNRISLLGLFFFSVSPAFSQMITGTWKGKINRQKVELKIIQKGDSLTGTSYYYESATHYRRYAIRGYFDANTNEAVWWDDQLLEEKTGKLRLANPGSIPLLSSADFNCLGGGKMMLDGKAAKKETPGDKKAELHLDKTGSPLFTDEWNFVIDNYLSGANDPFIIDSIAQLSQKRVNTPVSSPVSHSTKPAAPVAVAKPAERPVAIIPGPIQQPAPAAVIPVPAPPLTIEEKFISRKKILATEIPLSGDSIELRFYDNAEIDGDSISLFLNDNLIFQHIRLTGNAYTIKLSLNDLKVSNELIMVAENLGTIPPNTSYMIAICGNNRYEARLESTEGSSAMIRLYKPQ